MSDEDQVEETVEEEEVKDEPVADPWKERALAAEANQAKALSMLQQIMAERQQPVPLQHVKPNYDEVAASLGRPVDEVRGIAGAAVAEIAPQIEEIRGMLRAVQPKPKEQIAELMDEFGVKRGDVFKALADAQDELGVEDMTPQVIRRVQRTLAAAKTAAEPSRTAGTSGPSIPRGARRAETTPKVETLVETIKKDQRKRNLYAY